MSCAADLVLCVCVSLCVFVCVIVCVPYVCVRERENEGERERGYFGGLNV